MAIHNPVLFGTPLESGRLHRGAIWAGALMCVGLLGLAVIRQGCSSPAGIWGLTAAPDGRTVYFTEGPIDRCSLLALDLATGATRVVLRSDRYAGDPTCDPDGKWLLLVEGQGGRGQIKRLDLATGKTTPFIVSRFSDGGPTLSHDGETLAFVRYARTHADGWGGSHWAEGDLWVGPIRSGSYQQVTHVKADSLGPGGFLPDGRHMIIAVTRISQSDIYRLDLASGSMTPLAQGGFNSGPTLEPNSDMVVFVSDRVKQYQYELWRMRPDGAALEQITRMGRSCSSASFLPDGRSLVFLIDGKEIWRIDLDGKNLRRLYSFGETAKPSA